MAAQVFLASTNTTKRSRDKGFLTVHVELDGDHRKIIFLIGWNGNQDILEGLTKKEHIQRSYAGHAHDAGGGWVYLIPANSDNTVLVNNSRLNLSFRLTRNKISQAWIRANKKADEALQSV